ncbi:MAG: hypothetical protein F2623_04050, partial [Actinobacteria bacterium]|nr:hypothetical protein [Actinomycetota bacterium]
MSTATHNQYNFLNTTNQSSIRGKFTSRLRVLGLQLLVASIAVFGLQVGGASFASATGLTLVSSDPSDEDGAVPIDKTISFTFSEDIALTTGSITIKKSSDNTTFEAFDVATSSRFTTSGAVLTIDPTSNFDPSTDYHVLIDADAIVADADSNVKFPGILVPNRNFTTAPALISSSPADNATDIAVGSSIALTFSEDIALGTGSITIKKSSDNTTVEAFDVAVSSLVTISGAVLTIDPTDSLANSTEYYLLIDATAVTDTAVTPNSYAGIANVTTLSFTTALAAPTVTGVAITGTAQVGVELTVAGTIGGGTAATTAYLWEISDDGTSG